MAKRHFSNGGPPDQRDGPRINPPSRGSDQQRRALESNRNHIAKKARLTQGNNQSRRSEPEFSRDSQQRILEGNSLRGASLLVQLLNEFANDEASQGELRSLIGKDATDHAMKLREMIQPSEQNIKNILHRSPKMPLPEQPTAVLPSKLAEALNLTVSVNKYTVPPLPEIADPALAQRPFVHRGNFTNDHKRASTESYERLELLGDAYIEVIATRMLYPLYPDLPAGRLSGIREKLVCNETLAAFSVAYDFVSRAKVPEAYLEEGASRQKIWTKLLGDFFEAYVAAVIVSDPVNGFDRVETWLRQLWAPILPDADAVAEPNKTAKQELMRRLGGVGVRIVYESEREPTPYKGGLQWYIRCVLSGWGFEAQELGRFTGRSKQVAELGAAEEAMNNPLTSQAQGIKQKYDEKVRKERAEAAEKEREEEEEKNNRSEVSEAK